MTRPTTKLLLAGLLAAAILGFGGVGTASAAIRTYLVKYDGGLSETYSAEDTTAFDVQRAGLSGCDYSQHGDIQVSWTDVWRLKAKVQQRTAHVHVVKVTRVSGPFSKRHPGDSEITGVNSNEGSNTQCSDTNRAGTFDCTAEAVHESLTGNLKVEQDPYVKKLLLLQVPAFSRLKAAYSGEAPAGFGCAQSVGTNAAPGGFISADVAGGIDGFADPALEKPDLARLRVHKTLHVGDMTLPDDKDWLDPLFPSKGDNCALNGDGQDESCSFGQTNRAAELTIKRVG
jgi:hypothetical protein